MRGEIIRWAAVVSLLGASAAGAFYLYVFISGGTGEASEPISAPQLELPTTTATLQVAAPTASPAAADTPTATATTTATASAETPAPTEAVAPQAPATPTTATATTPTPEPTATVAPTATATPTETATAASSNAVPTAAVLYRIVPEESEVRFEIDEILRGSPTHVVGTTDQVAGDFIVDFANLEASQLGTIRINVRTLRTSEGRRDRAIRSQILQSARDEYEFTDFVPLELVGLPRSVEMGRPASFQIVGNLIIRDITQEVTFNAELTLVAVDRVEGTAVTTIQRADYGLRIPSVPSVAEVGEDVILSIDFVAITVEA